MNSQTLFNLVIFGLMVWVMYMMTFRTKDWLDLMKNNQERNDRIAKGLGRPQRAACGSPVASSESDRCQSVLPNNPCRGRGRLPARLF